MQQTIKCQIDGGEYYGNTLWRFNIVRCLLHEGNKLDASKSKAECIQYVPWVQLTPYNIEGHPTTYFPISCKINLKQNNDNEEPQNNCFWTLIFCKKVFLFSKPARLFLPF